MIAAVLAKGLTLARTLAALFKPFLPWIAVAVMGAAAWHFVPGIGPSDRIHRAAQETTTWKSEAGEQARLARNWKASFTASETLRRQEASAANKAVASEIERCASRVTEARQSARVIERIVTKEPTYDQNRCPVRELVDPDQLRQALQPGR